MPNAGYLTHALEVLSEVVTGQATAARVIRRAAA